MALHISHFIFLLFQSYTTSLRFLNELTDKNAPFTQIYAREILDECCITRGAHLGEMHVVHVLGTQSECCCKKAREKQKTR